VSHNFSNARILLRSTRDAPCVGVFFALLPAHTNTSAGVEILLSVSSLLQLQGKETDKDEIVKISNAIKSEEELSVCLQNYKKNGDMFVNQFFICPVYDSDKKLAYYLGTERILGPGYFLSPLVLQF
jgi:hypothetical protein